jgi:hypothetical protein
MEGVVEAAGEVVNADDPSVVNTDPNTIIPDAPAEAAPERPAWLDEKFANPEALAESYKALEAKLKTRGDDVEEEVRTSLLEEVEDDAPNPTIPDSADGYELPELLANDEAANTEALEVFREWAFERELGQDDFDELVSFYASTFLPDIDAEVAKLGDGADVRLDAINRWVGANVPEEHFGAMKSIMTTAANVEVIEAIMKLTVPSSMPGQNGETNAVTPDVKTKEDILNLMQSSNYMDTINRDKGAAVEIDAWFQANPNG